VFFNERSPWVDVDGMSVFANMAETQDVADNIGGEVWYARSMDARSGTIDMLGFGVDCTRLGSYWLFLRDAGILL